MHRLDRKFNIILTVWMSSVHCYYSSPQKLCRVCVCSGIQIELKKLRGKCKLIITITLLSSMWNYGSDWRVPQHRHHHHRFCRRCYQHDGHLMMMELHQNWFCDEAVPDYCLLDDDCSRHFDGDADHPPHLLHRHHPRPRRLRHRTPPREPHTRQYWREGFGDATLDPFGAR